jgi:hypothetical protein
MHYSLLEAETRNRPEQVLKLLHCKIPVKILFLSIILWSLRATEQVYMRAVQLAPS